MQTVHIESSFVYPSISIFIAVELIWASHQCHIHDSDIAREFQVDLVLAAMSALHDSIVGSIVGSVVGLVVGSICR